MLSDYRLARRLLTADYAGTRRGHCPVRAGPSATSPRAKRNGRL
jgi:hypothetical protein